MEFLHIYDTRDTYQYSAGILVQMQKIILEVFFLFFNLMLARYLPGLGMSEIRDLFLGGPIWIRLRNSGSFCVGQVPGTSHATRPKKHTCERRIYPSLSRPFAAGPASSLFMVVQSVLECDTYTRYNGTTVVASPVFSPYFLFFFVGWFLKKTQVLEEIILFAAVCCISPIKRSFFFAFVSLANKSACTRAAW